MDHCDLMNDTLLIAFEKLHLLKAKEAFFSFLCTISVRLLANNHRKKKPIYYGEENPAANVADENARADYDADIAALYEALAKLPEVQRECIILFEITGFSIKEIAKMQDSSIAAVKQRLKRGRTKLKEILNPTLTPKPAMPYGK